MTRALTIAAAVMLAAGSAAWAGPAEDATASITAVMDKFNAGDFDAFVAAHQDGALIVDEIPPYVWGGSGSIQRWGADYEKDSQARGISGGRVDLDKPLQATSDGRSAYVVMPSTYRFVQNGTKMAARGSMTFVMSPSGAGWKIASWTYSGSAPTPEN